MNLSKKQAQEMRLAAQLRKEMLQLRKSVERRTAELEEKKRELAIEAALERVRKVAMGMRKPDDLMKICKVVYTALQALGFSELRNALIDTFVDEKKYFIDYDYSAFTGGTSSRIPYSGNPVVEKYIKDIKKSKDAFFEITVKGKQLETWKEFRRRNGEVDDPRLNGIPALYYYKYSVGTGSIGISTYSRISKEKREILHRFRNVFLLAYRRYADIALAEAQAREARIELALERVRARAMAMQNSNELGELVSAVFKELNHLDFTLTSCIIWIHEASNAINELWIASSETGKPAQPFAINPFYPPFFRSIVQAWKAKDSHWTFTLSGKEKKTFEKAFLKELPGLPAGLQKAVKVPGKLVFSASFNKFGALEIVETEALNEEKFAILHRFGKVFESSYTRFNDLQKAEAQAREAQIEVALERIRAASLAMRESTALGGIIYKLYGELTKLDARLDRAFIMMVNPENQGITWWMAGYEGLLAENGFFVQMNQHPTHQLYLENCRQRKKKWTYLFEGKEKRDWDRFGFSKTELARLPEPVKKFMAAQKRVYLSGSSDQFGSLVAGSFEPLPQEQQDIISRFTTVFNQAYIRFIDLQKAEAQAREAQIQLALERVRARATAMHKSNELADVVALLHKQFEELGFGLYQILISIIDTGKQQIEWWSRGFGHQEPPKCYIIPFTRHPFPDTQLQKWQSGETYYAHVLEGEIKKSWEKYLFTQTELRQFPEEVKKQMRSVKQVYLSDAFMKYGVLQAAGPEPLPEDKAEILIRFAKVLDQAYTRMMDLQKAEAQAREGQIQLALERVRARTMAMQKSGELPETSHVLFEQMKELGEPVEQLTIGIVEEENKVIEISATLHGDTLKKIYLHSIDEPYMMSKVYKAWKAQQKTLIVELKGDELNAYNQYRNELTKSALFPTDLGEEHRRLVYVAFFSKGMLALGANEPRPPESLQLLERFASVFDLTYTRFLDLQRAEAQAKEARIEAALEKVRSRTMAMQNSRDLNNAAAEMFKEIQSLGLVPWACGFNIFDPDEKAVTQYMSLADGGISPPFRTPLTEDPFFIEICQARQRKEELLVMESSGESLAGTYRYMFGLPGSREIFGDLENAGFEMPTYQITHCAYFSQGYLVFITYQPVKEAHDIFRRFAKVFEQTYTRMMDLQKAEAQAREAQVEAALERVRSKSMSMHHSEELMQVNMELFDQLATLQLATESCWISLIDPAANSITVWARHGKQVQKSIVNAADFPNFRAEIDAWKNNVEYIKLANPKQEFVEAVKMFFGFEVTPPENADNFYLLQVRHKFGFLGFGNWEEATDEKVNICRRFTSVFEQTYTRFLDLQKAEVQGREAEIQLALERVRARSLAMHQTGELQDVVNEVAQQLLHMKIDMDGGIFITINDEVQKDIPLWGAAGAADYISRATVPYLDRPIYTRMLDAIHKRKPFLSERFSMVEKNEFLEHMFRNPPWSGTPAKRKKELLARKGGYCRSVAISRHTSIGMTNHHGKAFTEEENNILRRFGNVLEQSYTRFLDLQKAEAQAREAEIELALERVRARTMAMQRSDELKEAATVLYRELMSLRVGNLFNCGYVLVDEPNNLQHGWMTHSDGRIREAHTMPLQGDPIMNERYERWKSRTRMFLQKVGGKKREKHLAFVSGNTDAAVVTDGVLPELPDPVFFYCGNFSDGYLHVISREELSKEAESVLSRFTSVFEQTYTRFLDLQKAEAQAREAQIEAALERIRSVSMAIRKSNELMDIIHTVFGEWKKLGLELYECNINLLDREKKEWTNWGTGIGETALPRSFLFPWFDNPFVNQLYEDTLAGIPFRTFVMEGGNLSRFLDEMFIYTDFRDAPEEYRQQLYSIPRLYLTHAYMRYGSMDIVGPESPPEQTVDILKRFAKVFEQAYTRYVDVVQAEVQAREAQIEAALERVRSRSMAMHKSEELSELSLELVKQVQALGVATWFCAFNIYDDDPGGSWEWGSNGLGVFPKYRTPREGIFLRYYEAGQRGETLLVNEIGEAECPAHYEYLCGLPGVGEQLLQMKAAGIPFPASQIDHVAFFKHGYILFITYEPVPETHDIFQRFAKVFEQSYTRFLDLQKAEAQARDAQIEAALERVRAKAMAMHKSDDFNAAVAVVFDEMEKLDLGMLRCGIGILSKEKRTSDVWTVHRSQTGSEIQVSGNEPMDIHPLLQGDYDAWLRQEDFSYTLEGEDLAHYYRVLSETDFQLPESQSIVTANKDTKQYYYVTPFEAGTLFAFSETAFPEEAKKVMKRFANVFNLTYKRFLDLQNAEAQAREAQIEAALEKVRGKAMAMHSSSDVSAAASMVFTELRKLGINPVRCGVGLLSKESPRCQLYAATTSAEGDSLSLVGWATLTGHPVLEKIYGSWQASEDYFPVLTGEELKSYYKSLLSEFTVPSIPSAEEKQFGLFLQISIGCLYAWADAPYSESEIKIMKRFASIIDLTFRRYLELQRAEEQAREAQTESALEKVRSRTLAMQRSDELAETAAVLFQQLIALGIAPNRLYIILIRENTTEMEAWITEEDGSKVSMGFTGNYQKNPSLLKMYEGWREKRPSRVIDMQGEELQEYFHYLHDELKVPFKGGLEQKRRVQHIAYFSHGLIGMASPDPQPAETMQLLERFAAVFNLTFTRFNDLKMAEAHALQAEQDLIAIKEAKQKAEEALTELQATQKQLIQSEKMASLGELTAGIAHEIQNPLNFVNNFAEISRELIDELRSQKSKLKSEEQDALLEDIDSNLDKIHHHGKRADAIVKGMLQHSSSGSGKKEPTDINALADEYLRLAYHGLRAKDKTFQATVKTDFDESVGKIPVIPQDIGRVLLNLINNAFYACTPQPPKGEVMNSVESHIPTVWVSTKREANNVFISVKDNGPGIPAKILDKIFQPFFTTKPTGQGTGLGLSLSYDIVKAHGGALEVETKEGEGTEFMVRLPVN